MANPLKVMRIFGEKQVKEMQLELLHEMDMLVTKEKRFCTRKKVPRIMNDAKYEAIKALAFQCGTAYQVEALRRIILFYNIIPTVKEIEKYAAALETHALTDNSKDMAQA